MPKYICIKSVVHESIFKRHDLLPLKCHCNWAANVGSHSDRTYVLKHAKEKGILLTYDGQDHILNGKT